MAKGLAAKFGNTKTRTVILFFAVIFLIAISVALMRLSGSTDPLDERTSQTLAVPENIKAVPGNKTPEKYRELQIKDNEQRAEQARQGNSSAIPTIIHTDIVKGTAGGFGLLGTEIIHGQGAYGPYGLEADGRTAFGIGPDGQPYDTEGWTIHGYGPHGPYGIGPDGKPFGLDPNGNPYGIGPNGEILIGPDGKPLFTVGPNGEMIGPDGKPILGPDGKPLMAADYMPDARFQKNDAGYQVHGYGPYGPYGVDAEGNPFGMGPNGKPYDPSGPYAPEWYEPPVKSASQVVSDRLREDNDRVERMRREREERVKARQAEQAQAKQQAINEKDLKARSGAMDGQAKALFAAWSVYPTQLHITGKLSSEEARGPGASSFGSGGAGEPAQGGAGAGVRAALPGDEVITAGSILFAVIDTAVNSDEPGPVLAQVVHGDYKGARLIGQFAAPTQNSNALTLNFNQMVLPEGNKTLSISAVAVDPDTARTSVASDVDHHYLLRYGSLFASAFMEGYGKAVKEQGSARTENQDGSTTTSTKSLSGEEEFFSALGNVGTQWGSQTAPLFNTLPTITIDSGTGVGILFTSDLNITAASTG